MAKIKSLSALAFFLCFLVLPSCVQLNDRCGDGVYHEESSTTAYITEPDDMDDMDDDDDNSDYEDDHCPNSGDFNDHIEWDVYDLEDDSDCPDMFEGEAYETYE